MLNDPNPNEHLMEDKDAYNDWIKYIEDTTQASCLMLGIMIPEIQKVLNIMSIRHDYPIEGNVPKGRTLQNGSSASCMSNGGNPIGLILCFKMKSHIDHLERLDIDKRVLSILTINEGGN